VINVLCFTISTVQSASLLLNVAADEAATDEFLIFGTRCLTVS
jgi:hypothetical protein